MPRSGRNDGRSSLKYRDLMVKPGDDGREEHDRDSTEGLKAEKRKRGGRREKTPAGGFSFCGIGTS